jgi:hypothetical protein
MSRFLGVVPGVSLLLLLLAGLATAPAREEKPPALEVGFGEADITPKVGAEKPVYLAGFGKGRKATGVHDPLLARAVVLRAGKEKVTLVAIDVVGFFLDNVERVRAKLPGFTYVLVSSTHNHEGPDTLGLWGATALQSGIDPEYQASIEAKIVQAVKAADGECKATMAKYGTALAPELLHDGRPPKVLHDELVTLAFAEPGKDKLAGIVVQWNCHPETLDSKNTLVSADFVGYTVAALKKKHGCPVVYLTGTVGGLMTSLHVPINDPEGKELKDGTYEKTARYGELLSEVADKALRAGQPIPLSPLQVRTESLYLPVTNPVYRLAWQLKVLDRDNFVRGEGGKDWVKARVGDDPADPHIRTEVAYLKFGDLEVAAIPGEIYPELVLGKVPDPAPEGADFPDAPIEPSIYGQLKTSKRLMIGLANDEIGYIIPQRQWDEKPPYTYGLKKPPYGEINSLGPKTAPLLCEAFKRLTTK